jgi:hypothetical protein
MPDINFAVQNMMMMEYRIPTITAYNRLEVNPRNIDFDRSLKAEVRDPLWMLTRQWQFGEFQGEDAATAIGTKILGRHTNMSQLKFPGNNIFTYDETLPLETTVERERLRPDLSLAVQMGRYFIKLVKTNPDFATHFNTLLVNYPLHYVPDVNDYEGNQLLNAVNGKIFDGYLLYIDIFNGTVDPAIATSFTSEMDSYKNWYTRNYCQPVDSISIPWQPAQLEYKFTVSSSGEEAPQKTLVADHYNEGHLDWYSFDMGSKADVQSTSSAPLPDVIGEDHLSSFIPTPVSFKGMPNPRFWAMEDNQTDFGKIDVSPTGLLHLLFAEFGLVSSNDWLMLPYPLAINTLCEIKGIVVTDVFGQHILIRPAGRGAESQWQRWTMFHHTDLNNTEAGKQSFYLVPAVNKSLEGDPVEKVNFLRDEMANMVWAVEDIVPSQAGKGVSGDSMALKPEPATVPPPVTDDAPKIKYVLGTTVPDNWIPFIPVHIEGSDTEIRLQRAAMPGAKGALGTILKEKAAPYYIDEEIILRSGVQVSITAQRVRWFNGKTCLWFGRKTKTGKGEGWSNLRFDQVEDVI